MSPSLKTRLNTLRAKALAVPHKAFFSLFFVNLIVCVATSIHPEFYRYLCYRPELLGTAKGLVGILTHMFTHAGWDHFLGNFMWVAPFAIYLEGKIGAKKFLVTWFITGLGGLVLMVVMPHMFGLGWMLGASGCCFGVMATSCLYFADTKLHQVMAVAFLLLHLLPQMIAGVFSTIASGGTAYWAHAGAGMTAVLLAHYLKHKSKP